MSKPISKPTRRVSSLEKLVAVKRKIKSLEVEAARLEPLADKEILREGKKSDRLIASITKKVQAQIKSQDKTETAKQIRRIYRAGMGRKFISEFFGVSFGVVRSALAKSQPARA